MVKLKHGKPLTMKKNSTPGSRCVILVLLHGVLLIMLVATQLRSGILMFGGLTGVPISRGWPILAAEAGLGGLALAVGIVWLRRSWREW